LKQLSSLLKISVSIYFVFLSVTASGGDIYRQQAGAGEAGMGYACVIKNSFWSSFHNQALLAFRHSLAFGFSYENRFGIKELGTRIAGVTLPVGKASMSAIYSNFGYADFKRSMAGFGCGLKLSGKLYSGVQLDYLSEKCSGDFRHNQSVTFETGLLYNLAENTRVGIHLFNPLPNSLRKRDLPSAIRVGAGTDLNNMLFTAIEAELCSGNNLVVRAGFEYEAARKVWLRGGYSTDNNSFSFGLGFLAKIAKIDIGFLTHEKLGITSAVSMTFQFD
jgi:hypothetical protein